jgi:hypothetical protein
MIVVVNDYVGPLVKTATHPGATLPGFEEGLVLSEKMDITVYHEDYWNYLLRENVIRVILCMAIPKSMVLMEKKPIEFELNYQRLKSDLYSYISVHERGSKNFWAKKQIWNAKKKLLHVLRICDIAIQILQTGKIIDYTQANKFWFECSPLEFKTWNDLKKWFNTHHLPQYNWIREHVNIYKTVFPQLPTPLNQLRILDYLQFHNGNDVKMLDREISVRCVTIGYPTTSDGSTEKTKIQSNWHFFERGWDSPRHDAIQACSRVLTSFQPSEGANWKVLAAAPRKFWDWGADRFVTNISDRFVGNLDFLTTRVYKKPQGIGVLLFWNGNDFSAIIASSGLYCAQYCLRLGIPLSKIGESLSPLFWTVFNSKGYRLPEKEGFDWTFQFVFHPDEDLLQLDSIVNNTTLCDISMEPASMFITGESASDPLFEIISRRLSWDCLEYVPLTFPSLTGSHDQMLAANMAFMTKRATLVTDMSLLRFEGFLLVDRSHSRIQVSLPQYTSITLLYSPFERKYRTRHFLKIVRATANLPGPISGEERFCKYFPQWSSWYRHVAQIFRKVCADMDKAYEAVAKIEALDDFRAACDLVHTAHSRVFWKLRNSKSSAFEFFTDLTNLNEGPAPVALHGWVDEFQVFKDVEVVDS